MRKKKFLKTSLLLILVLTSFITLTSCNKIPFKNKPIDQARTIIKDNYITKVSSDVLKKTDIKDMVKSLNDPYSEYFTKEEAEKFFNSIDMVSYGLGVYIEKHDDGVKVIQVMDDSGAKEVGMQPGDIIIEAAGHSLKGLSTEEASHFTKGANGTSVNIKVNRNGKILDFNIKRKPIYADTVRSGVLNNNVGYIQIASFGEKTAACLEKNLNELKKQDLKAYVVDLRYNGGGLLNAALDIGGYFIGDKNMIIMENRAHKKQTFKAKEVTAIDKPMIFLINEYSASASEILAAAVKDYDKAFFVGNNSYGKGVAQTTFPLSDESVIKLTTKEFFSPTGKVINKVGVKPHLVVKDDKLDPLEVSMLLFSGFDSKNTIKVKIDNKDFSIDINLAKQHKAAFKHIIDNSEKEIQVNINSDTKTLMKDSLDIDKLAS